ncbi:MAG: bifunctional 5,10-methylenetetrahydrofolate dehydrogenase/5,10-methenyltetrahydrofolate cyclohydrolase [Eggerthellaceae bacterium]|nr:bifunctional 5,10-methylenetetrahydrofolate dehydrogenase/5,10-methenyltetrahydrofolate cyclohydrolase [Eggerthellaceae bacterium]
MARILKGAEVVDTMNREVAAQVEQLKAAGIDPMLTILRVGEQGDDISYERAATKRAEKVGVGVKNVVLPEGVSQEALLDVVAGLNADGAVHGVLMLRPLPQHLDEGAARNALDPRKDVDGITDLSLAGVFTGADVGFAPCTAQACMEILDHFGFGLEGRRAVVVGRSLVVGKPAAMMLLGRHATVTVAHSRTADLKKACREADVLVACVGRARMLGADYLAPEQVVLDVGINVAEGGSLAGDVDFDAACAIVDAITPVPDGVGTVTTSVLVKHVVQAAQRSLS